MVTPLSSLSHREKRVKGKPLFSSLSPAYEGEGEIPLSIPLPQDTSVREKSLFSSLSPIGGEGRVRGKSRQRACVRRGSYHGDDRAEIDARFKSCAGSTDGGRSPLCSASMRRWRHDDHPRCARSRPRPQPPRRAARRPGPATPWEDRPDRAFGARVFSV